ncbi:MAG: putative metalloprotease CJM1_0395 family protein [Candidatus Thiodiazotropha sp.]
MDLSFGMLSGFGNTASAADRTSGAGRSGNSETSPAGGTYADSAATPATRDSTTQRPVRESGESSQLTQEEKAEVRELQKRDREVRAHEAAHRAAAGGLASGGSYTYKRGPDGRSYAVAGEVSIRMPSTNSPEQRVRQAETVRRAALAPADPSPQDRQVAAQASAMAAQARSEVQAAQRQQVAENQTKAAGDSSDGEPAGDQVAPFEQRAIASFKAVGSMASLHSNPTAIDEMI